MKTPQVIGQKLANFASEKCLSLILPETISLKENAIARVAQIELNAHLFSIGLEGITL